MGKEENMKFNIEVKNLIKSYNKNDSPVIKNLNLQIEKGEVFGLIGRNGAGKSTTIKCICGILPFDSGKIYINGYDIEKEGIRAKKCLGYVSDNHYLYEEMSGREYLEFIAAVFQVEDYQSLIERYIKDFEIDKNIDDYISSYSHGMKQKISIISRLIHEPEILILDEPFTGLDVSASFQLKKAIKEYKEKGKTVFLTSHNIDIVEKLCDRIAIIKDGVILEIIDMQGFQKEESLERHFYEITGVNDEKIIV